MGGEDPAGSPEWSWNAAWDECHGVEREVRAKVCGVPRCRGCCVRVRTDLERWTPRSRRHLASGAAPRRLA